MKAQLLCLEAGQTQISLELRGPMREQAEADCPMSPLPSSFPPSCTPASPTPHWSLPDFITKSLAHKPLSQVCL